MWNLDWIATALLSSVLVMSACETMTAPPSSPEAQTDAAYVVSKSGGIDAKTTGGGKYELALVGEVFPGEFSFAAIQSSRSGPLGHLRYVLDLGEGIPGVIEGGIVAFHGEVTCVTVDRENGRAWVGGVVTKNDSTQPFYRDDATTQVGKDIWFRVLDAGEGSGTVDRTTFVGFEGGAGIITSEEYCDLQPWPDDNARTNPVVAGNIQVHK